MTAPVIARETSIIDALKNLCDAGADPEYALGVIEKLYAEGYAAGRQAQLEIDELRNNLRAS